MHKESPREKDEFQGTSSTPHVVWYVGISDIWVRLVDISFHRKPLTKVKEGCLESSAAQNVTTRGAVVTLGPTWARSVGTVRLWSTPIISVPSTGWHM